MIVGDVAPSYFLEGLLYNVPNDRFKSSYEDCIVNGINWIFEADRANLLCANEAVLPVARNLFCCGPDTKVSCFSDSHVRLNNPFVD